MKSIQDVITEQIQSYNEVADEKIDTANGEESVIYGKGSPLDSVGFVSLMLDIEQAVADELNIDITLVDARAMSQKHSPFRTIKSLAEYIGKLSEQGDE